MNLNALEEVMGQLELSIEREGLVEDEGTSTRGVKRPHSHSAIFNIVNGHARDVKRISDQYDFQMGFVNRGVPSRYLSNHRSQLSIDKAKLLLDIETIQKAEKGEEIRRMSLGPNSVKFDSAMDHAGKKDGMVEDKELKQKRRQKKANFLDWKMPELR